MKIFLKWISYQFFTFYNLLKKLFKWISYQFFTFYNLINFKIKKSEAMRLHKTTGRQYHVIPSGKNSLTVVDKSFIKRYNKLVKNKNTSPINIKNLLEMSYFSTPKPEGICRNESNKSKKTPKKHSKKTKKLR